MSDLLKSMVKVSGNTYANVVNEGIESDINGFVDTGSYTFNALLSGSIYGGIPDNKILAIAGESATGKTFFTISIVQKFLVDNPDAVVLYFDSEQAVTSEMLTSSDSLQRRLARPSPPLLIARPTPEVRPNSSSPSSSCASASS